MESGGAGNGAGGSKWEPGGARNGAGPRNGAGVQNGTRGGVPEKKQSGARGEARGSKMH